MSKFRYKNLFYLFYTFNIRLKVFIIFFIDMASIPRKGHETEQGVGSWNLMKVKNKMITDIQYVTLKNQKIINTLHVRIAMPHKFDHLSNILKLKIFLNNSFLCQLNGVIRRMKASFIPWRFNVGDKC